jgi:hypothetical protein
LDQRPDIVAAVERLPKNIRMFGRKELKKLPEVLWEGEVVRELLQGRYEEKQGILVLTDRRLLFMEEGVFRSRVEDFPFDKISSVQSSSGMMFGKLIIFASGNKATIDQVAPKEHAVHLAETLRHRLNEPASPAESPPPVAPSAPDVMDQLKRLGELRDAGVLTPEEFESKKAELLRRL